MNLATQVFENMMEGKEYDEDLLEEGYRSHTELNKACLQNIFRFSGP